MGKTYNTARPSLDNPLSSTYPPARTYLQYIWSLCGTLFAIIAVSGCRQGYIKHQDYGSSIKALKFLG